MFVTRFVDRFVHGSLGMFFLVLLIVTFVGWLVLLVGFNGRVVGRFAGLLVCLLIGLLLAFCIGSFIGLLVGLLISSLQVTLLID